MIEQTNDPEIVAEVLQSFTRYNQALDAGDTAALNSFFWNSSSTVRFGPSENLFGFEEIAVFRSSRWKGTASERQIERVAVTALGDDVATTNALIRSRDGKVSRQSQTWARLPEGWRIVAAHVSPLAE
ncbi:DUF3225 domain-containing protein [Microvirga sp. HBU67558]|uniref:AtzH-like domain-containing protein n=1 Tax=Microvirga TaxID=186650 RepID=UPI001B380E19|nr:MULTISPECIES: AtzH-like domain-containing protein [unclassified Microvirga]MBQ0819978.1 DUF3225 domain-containing protein [Microvirga sp. HBU67558]